MKKIYLALIALMLMQHANAQMIGPSFEVCLMNACEECEDNFLTASDHYGHAQTISNVPYRSEKCVMFYPGYDAYHIAISAGSGEYTYNVYPNQYSPYASFVINSDGSFTPFE